MAQAERKVSENHEGVTDQPLQEGSFEAGNSKQEDIPHDWYVDPANKTEMSSLEEQATKFLEENELPEDIDAFDAVTVGKTDIDVDSEIIKDVKVEDANVVNLFAPSPSKQPTKDRNQKSDMPQAQIWLELLTEVQTNDDDGELAWQADALCAQTDPEAFFPEKGGSTRDAKKVCGACPVRQQCLDYALENDERFGIWGGMSERERRRIRKSR